MPAKQIASPPKPELDALIAAASRGDVDAYEKVYNAFFPKISRFVAFRVGHRQTAEDLVADIFIKAWQFLQAGDTPLSFNSWIFTIARNKVIDHYRTKKTSVDLAEVENIIEYEDHTPEAIDADLASRKFLGVMDRLSSDQREVIRLKFIEDLDNEEIAAALGKTTGTIRVIQHRAIILLKKYLEDSPA